MLTNQFSGDLTALANGFAAYLRAQGDSASVSRNAVDHADLSTAQKRDGAWVLVSLSGDNFDSLEAQALGEAHVVGTRRLAFIYHCAVEGDQASSAVEDKELAALAHLQGYIEQLQHCVLLEGYQQSAQHEYPDGWLAVNLRWELV